MAKAKAKCKCKYCGAEFIREKTCRNRSEAESWESWAVDKLRECPKCYGERMRKAVYNFGISWHISASDSFDGEWKYS